MYQDTIMSVFDSFCDPNDEQCREGGDDIVNALNGRIPAQEQVPAEQTQLVSQTVNGGIQ
jgi:hypothetical protein